MPVITYLFDPLCGWCYGAAPTLDQLAALPDLSLDLAPIGLFARAGARRMDRGFAEYAWQNDQQIAGMTGQVFSEAYRRDVLGTNGGRFDSGPATLALTAVRLTAPGQERKALKVIQHTRYVEGRDIADAAVLFSILENLGAVEAAQRFAGSDDALLAAYQAWVELGQAAVREHGLRGVPALVVDEGTSRRALHADALFQDTPGLIAALQAA